MNKLTYDRLSPEEIEASLHALSGWTVEQGALSKVFAFDSYARGILFANAVAWQAEDLNHHPDLLIGYKSVTVTLRTHDAGGGLTAYDFELARRIVICESARQAD